MCIVCSNSSHEFQFQPFPNFLPGREIVLIFPEWQLSSLGQKVGPCRPLIHGLWRQKQHKLNANIKVLHKFTTAACRKNRRLLTLSQQQHSQLKWPHIFTHWDGTCYTSESLCMNVQCFATSRMWNSVCLLLFQKTEYRYWRQVFKAMTGLGDLQPDTETNYVHL